eukprot:499992_1
MRFIFFSDTYAWTYLVSKEYVMSSTWFATSLPSTRIRCWCFFLAKLLAFLFGYICVDLFGIQRIRDELDIIFSWRSCLCFFSDTSAWTYSVSKEEALSSMSSSAKLWKFQHEIRHIAAVYSRTFFVFFLGEIACFSFRIHLRGPIRYPKNK